MNVVQHQSPQQIFQGLQERYLKQEEELKGLAQEVEVAIRETDESNDIKDGVGSDIVSKHDAERVKPFLEEEQRALAALREKVVSFVKRSAAFKPLEEEIAREMDALEGAKFSAADFAKMKKHDSEKEAAFRVVYEANMKNLTTLKQSLADLLAHRSTLEGRITHFSEHPLRRYQMRIEDVTVWKDPSARYWLNRGKRYTEAVVARVADVFLYLTPASNPKPDGKEEI